MIVLGIESSCDDTSVALVDASQPWGSRILSLVTHQQIEEHRPYQGVVPEIAARSHLQHMPAVIQAALSKASLSWKDVTGIAATIGPGLIGGLLIGSTVAKTIAMALQKPFIGVHHLEGHLLTVRLVTEVPFPFLALLASGGHTQIVVCHDVGSYTVLGKTSDDALGECFDKTAKILQLTYPGGPRVEQCAQKGQTGRFALPRPLRGQPGCHFSFSGLKTSVKQIAERLTSEDFPDLAADFQQAVSDVLVDRLSHALPTCVSWPLKQCVFTGGVSANKHLRGRLETFLESQGWSLIAPPLHLCTDNGAMIAWAGSERFSRGLHSPLNMPPRPRWPL